MALGSEGEASVSVPSLARNSRLICRGVCPMGAHMYAWFGSWDGGISAGADCCEGKGWPLLA